MDTSVISTATREEGIDIYNTPTQEALNILKQLQVDLKHIIVIIKRNEMNTYSVKKTWLKTQKRKIKQIKSETLKRQNVGPNVIETFISTKEQEYQHKQ